MIKDKMNEEELIEFINDIEIQNVFTEIRFFSCDKEYLFDTLKEAVKYANEINELLNKKDYEMMPLWFRTYYLECFGGIDIKITMPIKYEEIEKVKQDMK
jgi:hypothetical protein